MMNEYKTMTNFSLLCKDNLSKCVDTQISEYATKL